ncbi:MAG: cation transporter [Treponema sp.]|jgi:copper chaperone CopZ|nr:cation transporter [Treponema sp.]
MITTLMIDGMSCDHCTAHVKEALEVITGVLSVQVSLKEKNALVEHNDSVTPEVLKEAVNEAGYEAMLRGF